MKLILKRSVTPVAPNQVEVVNPAKADTKNLDGLAIADIEVNPNCRVSWYLLTSYLYYVRDVSIISDHLFDEICRDLKDNFDRVKHWHKHLVDRRALHAGTGYGLPFSKFPSSLTGAAIHMEEVTQGMRQVPEPAQPKTPPATKPKVTFLLPSKRPA